MAELTVACMLRSGGVYGPEWVLRLRDGVARHLPLPHRFICMTDVSVDGVECRPLVRNDPKWWGKMELYREFERAMYFDLDTVIVRDLSPFAGYSRRRAVLRDFYAARTQADMIGTGMVLWNDFGMRHVWDAYERDPEGTMRTFARRSDVFTLREIGDVDRIQSLWPHQVVSYKAECQDGRPAEARVICMHGPPRLSELKPWHWLRKLWEAS